PVTPKDGESGSITGSTNLLPDAVPDPSPPAEYLACHSKLLYAMMPLLFLFSCSLACFSPYLFTYEPYTFTLVGLHLPQGPDLRRHLADQLLIDAFQHDQGVLPLFLDGLYFDFLWKRQENVMRVSKAEFQNIRLCGGLIADAHQFKVDFKAF